MSDKHHNSNLHNHLKILSEEAMTELGACLAKWVRLGAVIYLDGDLGAGKTTLVRGFLRAFGHQGAVKSPTFTLVEPYSLENNIFYNYNELEDVLKPDDNNKHLTQSKAELRADDVKIYHFDLYRLEDPEELEYVGIRDYLDGQSISLIEWPEKGYGVLPGADLIIKITHLNQGREVELLPQSENGRVIVSKLSKDIKTDFLIHDDIK